MLPNASSILSLGTNRSGQFTHTSCAARNKPRFRLNTAPAPRDRRKRRLLAGDRAPEMRGASSSALPTNFLLVRSVSQFAHSAIQGLYICMHQRSRTADQYLPLTSMDAKKSTYGNQCLFLHLTIQRPAYVRICSNPDVLVRPMNSHGASTSPTCSAGLDTCSNRSTAVAAARLDSFAADGAGFTPWAALSRIGSSKIHGKDARANVTTGEHMQRFWQHGFTGTTP